MFQADHSNSIPTPVSDPPRPSRRAALAALTGGAALAAWAALPAAATASGDPDSALLGLGAAYQRAHEALDAALEHEEACIDAHEIAKPAPLDALRHRVEDHMYFRLPMDGPMQVGRDLSLNSVYTADEIEMFRFVPPHYDVTADREQTARMQEISAAHRIWSAECEAARISMGVVAAQDAYKAALAARTGIVDQIVAAKAATLAGLQIRATIVRDIYDGDLSGEDDGDTVDRRLIWATIRDLAAMNG